MRIKALLALLGLGLALFFVAGCDDDDDVATATVTGTITNASTSEGQGNATVALLNNGVVIQTTQTSNDVATLGQYTFTGIPVGTGYTILVTSNEVPAAFADTTSNVFTVVDGTNVINLTVGTGVIGTVSGTVTNASTGLGQGNAEVELILAGNVIATTQTSNDAATLGQFSFTGVAPGADYTIRVTSTEVPAAFTTATTSPFTVTAGANTQNIVVGTGVGTTVSGSIDSIDTTSSYTVSVMLGATTVASATVDQGATPGSSPFSFSGIPAGSGYTIKAVNNTSGITTVFGPLTVPASGVSNVVVFPKTAAQLATDYGIPANANLVAFIAGGGTITANGVTSTLGNPTWLTNVPAGTTTTVTVTPLGGTPVQLIVPVSASNVTIIRFNAAN